MENFVEASVEAFVAVSMEVTSTEMELIFTEASVKASVKASVEFAEKQLSRKLSRKLAWT